MLLVSSRTRLTFSLWFSGERYQCLPEQCSGIDLLGVEVESMAQGGWVKEYIWVIASIIYVGGMFPIFLYYQANPGNRFAGLESVTILSVAGAFLLFGQLFVAAILAPSKKSSEKAESSK